MNIQEASRQTGLSPDTIRFYERHRVLPRPPRRENGYRDYAQEHLATLRLVSGLRHIEMSLVDMQEVARVAHDATCGDLRQTLVGQLRNALEQADARIRELEHTRGHIEACERPPDGGLPVRTVAVLAVPAAVLLAAAAFTASHRHPPL